MQLIWMENFETPLPINCVLLLSLVTTSQDKRVNDLELNEENVKCHTCEVMSCYRVAMNCLPAQKEAGNKDFHG